MLKDEIKKIIKNAPLTSGIYKFIGLNDEILYIGKAKNLRKRLLNYTKLKNLSARIIRMTQLTQNLEIIQTGNDLEAILLEHNLIKKLEPKFNILLRDDKSFALIAIDKKHDFGAIFKYRGEKHNDLYCFGPFASAFDVNKTIDALRKTFQLRNCSNEEFKRRKKPCLEYQIKKCSAPCAGLITKDEYQKSIQNAIDFLDGKSAKIQAQMAKKMQYFSDLQEYEKAALTRDQIKSLTSIQAKQNINVEEFDDVDVVCLVKEKNQYCFYISFYRKGNNYGSKPYFFSVEDDLSDEEFFTNFLGQFYSNQIIPKTILINIEIKEVELMQDFLSKIANEKIIIKNPKQGDKSRIIKDQELIAKKNLTEKINKNLSDKKILFELKEVFELEKIPQRIEVYDNSHTANENAVSAMIVADLEGFVKNQYRKFNLKLTEKNRDDTAMLKEALLRRFKNLEKNSDTPDLIIIDGGLPQLSAAQEIFSQLKIKTPLICMAKGEKRNAGEETYFRINKDPIKLTKNSSLAFYLQRLRDEAHRFAITTHRAKRAKSLIKSQLDEIKGIGNRRKKSLLNYFGSIEKIKQASIEDLTRVSGINKKVAEKILNFLNTNLR